MISDKYEAIFVHVPRTAGQSVERAFLELHGLDWNTRGELLLRAKDEDEPGPPRLAHLTTKQYTDLGYIDGDKFNQYFKFSVVRNPYDRIISLMRWWNYSDLGKFLDEKFPQVWEEMHYFVMPQVNYLYSDDELLVDFVLDFHNLEQGWHDLCRALDIDIELPHVNRSEHDPYQEYYDEELRARVRELYSSDLKTFQFVF